MTFINKSFLLFIMDFDVQWDSRDSMFDNIFNKKKKKPIIEEIADEEEKVVNEYTKNYGWE